MLHARSAKMVATCSIMSHPGMDVKNANSSLKSMYLDTIGTLPYVTGGVTGEDVMSSEREGAAKEFTEYRTRVLGDKEKSDKLREQRTFKNIDIKKA
jgi:hypothetical protein